MSNRQDIEFKTLDGVTLRGWLWPAKQRGPAIILTTGLNWPKDALLPDVAAEFQRAGFTVLAYDNRCVGASDGLPRDNIIPVKCQEDYHDAVTFMKTHPLVDPDQLACWGYSMSGVTVLNAAALDKRIKAVISVCPGMTYDFPKRKQLLAKIMKDRESQAMGNDPLVVPVMSNGYTPSGIMLGSDVESNYMQTANSIPGLSVVTTLQSHYNMLTWDPTRQIEFLSPTPTLILTAEKDEIMPLDLQKSMFIDRVGEPKQWHVIPGQGHLNALSGDNFPEQMEVQVNFLRTHLCA
ncbi:Alpha/Beta hydrolase protein [Xylariales sp. PMI_506]|nr:Alpha/Beta hydrolase protein [Xylariales sp. PMI_506]